MLLKLSDLLPIVGYQTIDELMLLAQQLKDFSVLMVHSSDCLDTNDDHYQHVYALLRELGLPITVHALNGEGAIKNISMKIHAMLNGKLDMLTRDDTKQYEEYIDAENSRMHFGYDCVCAYNAFASGLSRYKSNTPWVWICDTDLSRRDSQTWKYFYPFIQRFDMSVVSLPSTAEKIDITQMIIYPSINPLNNRCEMLDEILVKSILNRFHITKALPIIAQLSSFAYSKDPLGVIDMYRLVKKYINCQLVLAGEVSAEDIEAQQVLIELTEYASDDADIHIIPLPYPSHIEINALQHAASVIIQKSIHDTFPFPIAEALWKSKPVIATPIGGIPLLISHKHTGLLSQTTAGISYWLKHVLQDEPFSRKLGINGRRHVQEHFLITRQIKDYLLLFLSLKGAYTARQNDYVYV